MEAKRASTLGKCWVAPIVPVLLQITAIKYEQNIKTKQTIWRHWLEELTLGKGNDLGWVSRFYG